MPDPVHLSRKSGNEKTGPIPVSTSSKNTCPPSCALRGQGCYAENYPMIFHWNTVTNGDSIPAWEDFVDEVSRMKRGQLWRHNQAGDLAGMDDVIDKVALKQLVKANAGKRGFTYTHYPMTAANRKAVEHANANGFTVNLSADSLDEADTLAALGVGPVVAIVPIGWRGTATPEGRKVTVCPAQSMEYMTCAVCQLCQKSDRHAVVAFEAHGSRRMTVQKVILMKTHMKELAA